MDITWKRKWIFWLLLAVMLLFLPGKTFAAEKESREAEKQRIHTFIIRLLMQRRALRSVI